MLMVVAEVSPRFWSKVDERSPAECWEWTAALNNRGYGQFWLPLMRTMALSHRVAYVLAGGVLADRRGRPGAVGELVLHRCDNPPCCNPHHLSLGDHGRNMAEKVQRGRCADSRGERNSRARLTAEQVAEIRRRSTGTYGEQSALAREFGVSVGAVAHVIHGRSW